MVHKYSPFDIWNGSIPAKCSWFYRGLYRNALLIRPFLWMNHINLALTSFLNDPWYFEIPINLKPTFLNMDIDYGDFQINDLLVDIHWNLDSLHIVFGNNINDNILCQSSVNYEISNHWVWFPNSKGPKVANKIYSFFNLSKGSADSWDGWGKIWRLKVAPRVKYFIWLLLHNAVQTIEYLYHLNLGPQTMCSFCNLLPESAEHLFLNCHKSQQIWNLTCSIIGKHINLSQGISSGYWLDQELSGNDSYIQSVIAATIWFIWKARCNRIFKMEELDCQLVSIRATGHVREYSYASSLHLRNNFIMHNFDHANSPIMMIAYAHNSDLINAGLSFVVYDSNSNMVCSGCCGSPVNTDLEAAVCALSFALQSIHNWDLNCFVKTILSSSALLITEI